mmetsp:Transcript_5117/g.8164  ORF Transcript_5117/g.8164 Transcript_5117/m.8164 type:complete len:87 (+) Transcript_5117:345-605(+)
MLFVGPLVRLGPVVLTVRAAKPAVLVAEPALEPACDSLLLLALVFLVYTSPHCPDLVSFPGLFGADLGIQKWQRPSALTGFPRRGP